MRTNRRAYTPAIRDNRIYDVVICHNGTPVLRPLYLYRRRFASGAYTGPYSNRPTA